MLHGAPVPLSKREYSVLRVLIQRSGEPFTKKQIIERVFPEESDVHLEAVEVFIHRLRKKLEGSGVSVVTLRGLGYALEIDAPKPSF